jgi:ATP-binding cassette subfamily B protein
MLAGVSSMWMASRSLRQAGDGEDLKVSKGLVARVWRIFARPYRGRLWLLFAAIALSSGLAVVPTILVGQLIDKAVLQGDVGLVRVIAGLAVGVAVATALISLAQRYLSSWVGEHLILDLRRALFDHVQSMPLAFFTRTQTGALISRLNNDIIGAQRAVTGTFTSVLSSSILLVVALAVMLRIEWRLTFLVIAVLPVFILPARRVGQRLSGISRRAMELNAEMNSVMTERFNVAGAQLVKLFGDRRSESEGFSGRAAEVADIGVRTALVGRVFFVALAFVGALGTAVVYLVGGQLAITSPGFSTGDIVTFAELIAQAYGPLTSLTNARVEVMGALVSFDRVFEILDVEPPIADAPGAVALDRPRGDVRFEEVRFAYPSAAESSLASLENGSFAEVLDDTPGATVLDGVSFHARPGETVALVGPSGAGKTTICNLVPRLYDVREGAVRLDGRDVRDVTLASLSRAVGVVTQDPHVFHDTVRANLRYARPEASDAEVEAACRGAQIHHVIAALPDGYDTLVGERGYRLSGGEKQRLAIARVLLKDPSVVILDEATAHLDSESEALVQEALATILAGRTSLVIAHRLSTIVSADQILVVAGGRVVQRGTHAELVDAEGLYASLYRTQFAAAGATAAR